MVSSGGRATGDSPYLFEYSDTEEQRLIAQGAVLDPITRRFLVTAGIGSGMRVLDLGSGVGNVARLAAELVGPEGSVLGVDKDADAIARARRREPAPGGGSLEYYVTDVHTLDGVAGPFDAVIGRTVLAYIPDSVSVVRAAAALLRPGGVLCLQEADMANHWSVPETPLWRQIREWFLETLNRAGFDPQAGHALFPAFRSAGLPDPEVMLEAPVGGGKRAPAFGWANVLAGVAPAMERMGVATREELQPETLTERLLAETEAANGVVVGPLLIGAWARTPTE